MISMAKGISVLIACYNSEKVIQATLEHLQAQIVPESICWEVVLVNNNSNDKTVEIVSKTWARNPVVPLTLLKEEKVGLAYARKTSILGAKYDILCIVDDDNRVEKDWISKTYNYFKNEEIGLVGCAGTGDFEKTPPQWFEENQLAFAIGKLYEGDFVDVTKYALVPGAGMSIRKKIYEDLYEANWIPYCVGRIGNKQTAGDDSEICLITRLLGYKIYYSNEISFNHFTTQNRITWERLENMTYGFGQADVFTLIYDLIYKEQTGTSSLISRLRKFWWFNYIGKRIALFLQLPFYKPKTGEISQKKLLYIRYIAFCETILLEKDRFRDGFKYIEKIVESISTKTKTALSDH